ncbi:MAG: UbiA family prenyltransferase [Verrucomicrobiota bacterium]
MQNPLIGSALYWLKVSRPGLWFQTVWLYLLPTSQNLGVFSNHVFWVGLFYITFPLNLLVYGVNDRFDIENDRNNIRKDSYLWGAKPDAEKLKRVFRVLIFCHLPFVLWFAVVEQYALLILAGVVVSVFLYNHPSSEFKSKSPFELLSQWGYLLVVPLSCILNQTGQLSLEVYIYLGLFCTHAHLIGQVLDIQPDLKAGRKTTVIRLGIFPSKLVIASLVLLEAWLVWIFFNSLILALFLFLGFVALLVEALFFNKESQYTKSQFLILGYLLNISGYISILYIWYTGIMV